MIEEAVAMELLAKLKTLLGIKDDESDDILLMVLNDCVSRVLGYCRRRDMPDGLITLIPFMAVQAYRLGGYGQKDAKQTVTQVTQGNRSVSFDNGETTQKDWLNDFKERLEPFRIRKGRVPSELDTKSGESV